MWWRVKANAISSEQKSIMVQKFVCETGESILCGFVVGKELWELVFQHSLVWRAPGVTPVW